MHKIKLALGRFDIIGQFLSDLMYARRQRINRPLVERFQHQIALAGMVGVVQHQQRQFFAVLPVKRFGKRAFICLRWVDHQMTILDQGFHLRPACEKIAV